MGLRLSRLVTIDEQQRPVGAAEDAITVVHRQKQKPRRILTSRIVNDPLESYQQFVLGPSQAQILDSNRAAQAGSGQRNLGRSPAANTSAPVVRSPPRYASSPSHSVSPSASGAERSRERQVRCVLLGGSRPLLPNLLLFALMQELLGTAQPAGPLNIDEKSQQSGSCLRNAPELVIIFGFRSISRAALYSRSEVSRKVTDLARSRFPSLGFDLPGRRRPNPQAVGLRRKDPSSSAVVGFAVPSMHRMDPAIFLFLSTTCHPSRRAPAHPPDPLYSADRTRSRRRELDNWEQGHAAPGLAGRRRYGCRRGTPTYAMASIM